MSGSLASLCLWTSLSLRRQISKSTKTILALSITGFCGKAEKSMQPEPRGPGPSIDWLRYARADLALARVPSPRAGYKHLGKSNLVFCPEVFQDIFQRLSQGVQALIGRKR